MLWRKWGSPESPLFGNSATGASWSLITPRSGLFLCNGALVRSESSGASATDPANTVPLAGCTRWRGGPPCSTTPISGAGSPLVGPRTPGCGGGGGMGRAEPYRVDWRAPDGRWVHGAPLPFVAVKASDREKCWAMERWFGRVDPCDPAELPGWPEVMPPFVSLWPQGLEPVLLAGADGHLVIARTPSAASPEHRYDVVA